MAKSNASLPAWFSRAIATGLLLVASGAVFGGLLGLVAGVTWGGIAALSIASVGGVILGMLRLGGAGFGLGIVSGIAAMMGAAEFRHAVAARGDLQTLASLADWDPASGASRLRIPPVEQLERFTRTLSRTYRGSRGGSTAVLYTRATPWTEGARVVGYACIVSSDMGTTDKGASATSGAFAMSAEARDGELDENCVRAIDQSETEVRRAGIDVAPSSAKRVVRVYASEADLRGDHEAARAFWGPGIFLAVYLAGVLVFRLVQARKSRPPPLR